MTRRHCQYSSGLVEKGMSSFTDQKQTLEESYCNSFGGFAGAFKFVPPLHDLRTSHLNILTYLDLQTRFYNISNLYNAAPGLWNEGLTFFGAWIWRSGGLR